MQILADLALKSGTSEPNPLISRDKVTSGSIYPVVRARLRFPLGRCSIAREDLARRSQVVEQATRTATSGAHCAPHHTAIKTAFSRGDWKILTVPGKEKNERGTYRFRGTRGRTRGRLHCSDLSSPEYKLVMNYMMPTLCTEPKLLLLCLYSFIANGKSFYLYT